MPEPMMDERLAAYLGARFEEHRREIEQAWPVFEAAMGEFVDAHRGDATLGAFVARMVRETAVAAFVRGTMHAAGKPYLEIVQPGDGVMFGQAVETCRMAPDLYPAFALFDGRNTEPDDETGEGER